jgi:hypothetical protein
MHLRKRVHRLEALRAGRGSSGPFVVFLAEMNGEIRTALLAGSGSLARLEGEPEADFIERAESAVSRSEGAIERRRHEVD